MQFKDIDRNPSKRLLRQFSALLIVIVGGMGAYRLEHGGRPSICYAVIGAAVTIGLLGLALPIAVRRIYVGWNILAFPIGWAVSKVVLALAYFSIFTFIAILFRLFGRDKLILRKPAGTTYWTERRESSSVAQYFQQF